MLSIYVLAAVVAASLVSGVAARADAGPLTGSVELTNKTWICRGPVDLTSVSVTMDQNFVLPPGSARGADDAIHLGGGCTGHIGSITVVQYHGDAIKVGGGAHDLVIDGGTIRCYGHDTGKHQDGIQAMGGQRVVFHALDIQCDSANNAAFFANRGTNSPELPTDVVCEGCFLEGGGITVRIGNSVRSGVRDSIIVAGHFSAVRIDKQGAADPVYSNNSVGTPGQGLPRPVPRPVEHQGPPKLIRSGPTPALLLRPVRLGAVALVATRIGLDEAAVLKTSLLSVPSGKPVPLLRGSQVGTATTGYQKSTIVYAAGANPALLLRLRISPASLRPGLLYRLRVSAVDPAGRTSLLTIPLRA